MNVFWGLGKCLALLFWLVVLINLYQPLINPFHVMINMAGSLLLLTHLLELVLFNRSVKHRPHPWRDRLQILLVGILHVRTLDAPATTETTHA